MKKILILTAALIAALGGEAAYESPMRGSFDMYGVTNAVVVTNFEHKVNKSNCVMKFNVTTNFVAEYGIHQFGWSFRPYNNESAEITRMSAVDFVLPFALGEEVSVKTNAFYWLVKSAKSGKGAIFFSDYDGAFDSSFTREEAGLRVRIGHAGYKRRIPRDWTVPTPVISYIPF